MTAMTPARFAAFDLDRPWVSAPNGFGYGVSDCAKDTDARSASDIAVQHCGASYASWMLCDVNVIRASQVTGDSHGIAASGVVYTPWRLP